MTKYEYTIEEIVKMLQNDKNFKNKDEQKNINQIAKFIKKYCVISLDLNEHENFSKIENNEIKKNEKRTIFTKEEIKKIVDNFLIDDKRLIKWYFKEIKRLAKN